RISLLAFTRPSAVLPTPFASGRRGCCSPWSPLSSMWSQSSSYRRSMSMASTLVLRQYIDLPFHPEGDFDHGDVSLSKGYVFIANTKVSTVEVVDGERLGDLVTIPDCPEASGV